MVRNMSASSLARFLDRFSFDSLFQLADRLIEWRHVARQRRDLAALDDCALRDLGLSRGDVLAESSKPFWRR
jgi:uncharacterized protein YjiS (DUF1127 family)